MEADLDNKINWEQFYRPYIKNLKPTGNDKMVGLCPFHDDKKPSFWFNAKNGCWKCEACGEQGNGQTFLQKIENLDKTEAYKKLLSIANVAPVQRPKYTLQNYSEEKCLPLDFLTNLGIKNGKLGISIPYMDESGAVISTRQRYAPSSPIRFSWNKGSRVIPYGLWLLKHIKEQGYVVLVEGESDAHTLWLHDIPALGIPGASTFQESWVDYLEGLKIYVHKEPENSGEVFTQRIYKALHEKQFTNKVYQISINGCKDPSELYISDCEHFLDRWKAVMEAAREIDISKFEIKPGEVIKNAPVRLRIPAGWRVSANGIEYLNDKSGLWVLICRTPILLNRRLKSLDTGEEKMEIAFLRDEKWHTYIVQRSVLFQSRAITQLADIGITITSENAKQIVRYLGDLEAENIDMLDMKKAVTQLGWYGKNFLPGAEGDLVIDVEPESRRWIDAYSQEGDPAEWIEAMKEYRKNNLFRFIMAGAFAAPLLKFINHRVFVIHNWGDSRIGKTAALKAALSVWGNPESLIANFNATKVGIERLASFYNDLPLGIDEKQVAFRKQEFIESLIYMLSLGASKTRGTKTGGLQASKNWRSIILTTGEEPLSSDSSLTGIHSRTLEIYGSPFFEGETEAAKIHNIVASTYGHAGAMFIQTLLNNNPDIVKDLYKKVFDELSEKFKDKIDSHISYVAIITAADMLASKWIFNEEYDSMIMATEIMNKLKNVTEIDVIEQAYEFVCSWLVSNEMQFVNKDKYNIEIRGEKYGVIECGIYYVFPYILKRALEKEGFSYRKTIQGFADRGKISTTYEKSERRYQVTKRLGDKVSKFIEFDLGEIDKKNDETSDETNDLPF